MSALWQPVRGTKDWLGAECHQYHRLVNAARTLSESYGFSEIMTPIFESAGVFLRSLGDATDIVSKEMYILEDRGGEKLALRPEGTAGVMRAFASNNLHQRLPQKLFYAGPMFRYERPQKGRLRQFHQIGVEVIGAVETYADIETIALGHHLLRTLGLGHIVTLKINTLGDAVSRQGYREALVTYFQSRYSHLSPESQVRLEKNPLRILDSKDPGDRALLEEAPRQEGFLTKEAQAVFESVLKGLEALSIPYERDPYLVRGLDYYTHTTFEFIAKDLGAQNAVLAGGRYTIATEGVETQPSVGWAAGIERLVLLLDPPVAQVRPLALIPIGEAAEGKAFVLAQAVRAKGHRAIFDYHGNPGKRLKRAAKENAFAAWIVGEEELQANTVTWRDMDTGAQQTLGVEEAFKRIPC